MVENGRVFCSEMRRSICSGTERSITIGARWAISSAFPAAISEKSYVKLFTLAKEANSSLPNRQKSILELLKNNFLKKCCRGRDV
jgi:hypothetical protein